MSGTRLPDENQVTLVTLPELSDRYDGTPGYREIDVLRWARTGLITTQFFRGRRHYVAEEVGRRLGL